MDAGVEKGKKSKHPAKPSYRVPTCQPPQRRDTECQNEKSENPVTGGMSHCLDGVRAQVSSESPPRKKEERDEAQQEYENLQAFDQKFVRRFSPVYIFST